MYTYINTYTYTYICAYRHIFIYIYIYMHTYIHMYGIINRRSRLKSAVLPSPKIALLSFCAAVMFFVNFLLQSRISKKICVIFCEFSFAVTHIFFQERHAICKKDFLAKKSESIEWVGSPVRKLTFETHDSQNNVVTHYKTLRHISRLEWSVL